MDSFFNSLDEVNAYQPVEKKLKHVVMKEYENHLLSDGMIICKCCNNVISNIIDTAEWRFYGANDSKSSDPTRCGMPVNQLLPESSVGSFISTRGGRKNQCIKFVNINNGVACLIKKRTLLKVFQEHI